MVKPDCTRKLVSIATVPAVVLWLLVFAAGAKSAKVVTSWFNPEYHGQKFHKVLVIGVAQDTAVRADFEDAMAAVIKREAIETIPGNQILLRPDPAAKADLDYLRQQIRDNGIDAVIVTRLSRSTEK